MRVGFMLGARIALRLPARQQRQQQQAHQLEACSRVTTLTFALVTKVPQTHTIRTGLAA